METFQFSVQEFKCAVYELGTEILSTLIAVVKVFVHTILLLAASIRGVQVTSSLIICSVVRYITRAFSITQGNEQMLFVVVGYISSLLVLDNFVLGNHVVPTSSLFEPNAVLFCSLMACVEFLLQRCENQPSRCLKLYMLLFDMLLLLAIVMTCSAFPRRGDVVFFLDHPIGTCLVGFNSFVTSHDSRPDYTLTNAVLRSAVVPSMTAIYGRRKGWILTMYLMYKAWIWGSSVGDLACHIIYQDVVGNCYSSCTADDVAALRSQNEVCPVCLEEHDKHSCRLECNHAIHIACLVRIVQSDTEHNPRCPVCRQDLQMLNEALGIREHMYPDDSSNLHTQLHIADMSASDASRRNMVPYVQSTSIIGMSPARSRRQSRLTDVGVAPVMDHQNSFPVTTRRQQRRRHHQHHQLQTSLVQSRLSSSGSPSSDSRPVSSVVSSVRRPRLRGCKVTSVSCNRSSSGSSSSSSSSSSSTGSRSNVTSMEHDRDYLRAAGGSELRLRVPALSVSSHSDSRNIDASTSCSPELRDRKNKRPLSTVQGTIDGTAPDDSGDTSSHSNDTSRRRSKRIRRSAGRMNSTNIQHN